MVVVRLAQVPKFGLNEFHPSQVEYYAKYSELMYRILKVKSVPFFVRAIMNSEGIPTGRLREIRVMRLPAHKSRQLKKKNDKRQLMGRYSPKNSVIELYPLLIWPDEKRPLSEKDISFNKKLGEIGVHTIKTLFHEILHIKYDDKKEENRVKKLTDHYIKQFEKFIDRRIGS